MPFIVSDDDFRTYFSENPWMDYEYIHHDDLDSIIHAIRAMGIVRHDAKQREGWGSNEKKKKPLSNKTRAEVWDKTGGLCWYCEAVLNPHRNWSIDHVTPISRGGSDELDNLVPCCKSCNSSKHNRDGWERGCRVE